MTPVLNHIAWFSVLLPPVALVFNWRSSSGRQRLLAGFCILAMGLQLIARALLEQTSNTMPAFHAYLWVEFLAFSAVYYFEWQKEILGKVILVGMGLFSVLAFISGMWFPGWTNTPALTQTVSHVVLLVYACIFMVRTLKEMRYERLETIFLFWFSTGILIYFAGTLLQSIFSGFLITTEKVYWAVWASRDIFTVLFYILCTVSMLCKDPKTLSSPFSSPAP